MPNSYYNQSLPIARFITASSTRLNQEFRAIEAAFAKLPTISELNSGSRAYAVAAGTANAYTVTVPYPLPAYPTGLDLSLLIPIANTGPATLAVNGLPAVQVRRFDGTVLTAGDLRTLSINRMIFDGVNFRLTSVHGSAELLATTSAGSAAASATSAAGSAAQAANSALSAAQSAISATAAASTATAIVGSTGFGLKNLLLNPLWWISQHIGSAGTESNYTASPGYYVRDRWKAGPSGLTFRIDNGTMTIVAGSVQQIVQGRNLPFTNKYTLSWSGTAAAAINGTAVTNGASMTLPGYQHATVTFSGGTLYLPQLEYGPVKTAFELRPTDLERSLCLQYFQKSYAEMTPPGSQTTQGAVHCVAVSSLLMGNPTVQLHAPMRALPVITLFNPLFENIPGSIQNIDTNVAHAYSVSDISDKSFVFFSSDNGFVTGGRHFFHWTANAEL